MKEPGEWGARAGTYTRKKHLILSRWVGGGGPACLGIAEYRLI